MKKIKFICFSLFAVSAIISCTKVTNNDISFIGTTTVPSNFSFTSTVTLAGLATVVPVATGVASFSINFGDNSPSITIAPGSTGTKSYSNDGTYTIRVVARNLTGDSAVLTKQVTVTTSLLLVDFETPATTYGAGSFGGAAFAKVANPSATGINTSANVGKITKGSAGSNSETWAGITINTSAPFAFSNKGIVKMKVYSARVGANILLKLEGPSSGGTVETAVRSTVANSWEELTFVMDPSVVGRSFGGFSIFYEFGLAGNGSANFIGHFDDIKIFP